MLKLINKQKTVVRWFFVCLYFLLCYTLEIPEGGDFLGVKKMGRPTDNSKPHQMTIKFDDECKEIIEDRIVLYLQSKDNKGKNLLKIRVKPLCLILYSTLTIISVSVMFRIEWGLMNILTILMRIGLPRGIPSSAIPWVYSYIINSFLIIVPMAVVCIISLYGIARILFNFGIRFTYFSAIACLLFFSLTIWELLTRLDNLDSFWSFIVTFGGINLICMTVAWVISNLIIKKIY